MLDFDSGFLRKHNKIENKSEGMSTKNYVAFDKVDKKNLKIKYSTKARREQFQGYLYSNILDRLKKLEHRFSSFSNLQVSIHVHLQDPQKDNIVFYIQRPFLDNSLKDIFQSGTKMSKGAFSRRVRGLLALYTQSLMQPLPLHCPSNLLQKKKWNGSSDIFLNYTSLVEYHFLVEKSPIYISQFKQIYCYLHPKVFDQNKAEVDIDFTCKLFSFAMNLFSLAINKEVSYPLFAGRNQLTFTIEEAKSALDKNFQKTKQLLNSKMVREQLREVSKQRLSGMGRINLIDFFEEVFMKETSSLTSWIKVCQFFDRTFLDYYVSRSSNRIIQAIEKIYQHETQQMKVKYEKMGVIKKNHDVKEVKKQLILYILLKQNMLGEVGSQMSKGGERSQSDVIYNQKLYIFYKKIEQTAFELQRQEMKDGQRENELLELNVVEEIQQGLKFNLYQANIGKGEHFREQSCQIYAVSDFQQILNEYGSSLWM